jgi:16S rRNA (guanine966-N2)-methyltransferase
MRVISGKFKGKKISLPIDNKTRPLRDLVKESIFNLLNHSNKIKFLIENSEILDLFSGSGSFGLECISRNANNVTFVENYNEALKVLKRNILSLGANKNSRIIEKNCFDYFNLHDFSQNNYDLIFMDPPFKEKNINLLIDIIIKKKILKKDGILIIHRHKKDNIKISKNLKIIDERNYGISKIILGN